MPSIEQVQQALTQVIDPELGRNIVELGMARDIQIEGGDVTITLALTVMGCPLRNYLQEATRAAAASVPGVEKVTVKLAAMTEEERRQALERISPAMRFNRVGRMIAVMSGKGGVGKSSVAALLAAALQARGHAVGVLDADVTGPSIPRLFGLHGPAKSNDLGMLPTETGTGVKVMSVNLLLREEDMAVVWPAHQVASAIKQFWTDVLWGPLDYLLVDLPPGIADATFAVMQSLPLDGVILVTTPQSLSAMVVRKAVHTCQHMQTPILGVVENMSYFTCPETGTRHEIFGASHTDTVAEAAGAPVLGRLPLDTELTRLTEAGQIDSYEHAEYTKLAAAFVETVPAPAQPAAPAWATMQPES